MTNRYYFGCGYKSYRPDDPFGMQVFHVTAEPSFHGETGSIYFGIIATAEDFQRSFSVDAEFSAAYEQVSGKMNASFTDQFSRAVTTVTVALAKQCVKGTGKINLQEYQLENAPAAMAGSKPVDYVRVYGDQVVESVSLGGACYYLFSYAFKTESDASAFKSAVNVKYGPYGGDLNAQYDILKKSSALNVSLMGYSTGTVQVPKILRDKDRDWNDGARHIFGNEVAGGLLRNLFEYFDSFSDYFTAKPSDTDAYTQVRIHTKTLSDLPSTLFPSHYDDLLKICADAKRVSTQLDKQLDQVLNIQAQLDYMTSNNSKAKECNTPRALKEAEDLKDKLKKDDGVISQLKARRESFRSSFDTASNYHFQDQIPPLPPYFCTADPEVREDQQSLPYSQSILREFGIGPDDFVRTCRVKATALMSHPANESAGHDLSISLVKKDLNGQWQVVPGQVASDAIGYGKQDGGASVHSDPFIASASETYAVRVICTAPNRSLTLETALSKKL